MTSAWGCACSEAMRRNSTPDPVDTTSTAMPDAFVKASATMLFTVLSLAEYSTRRCSAAALPGTPSAAMPHAASPKQAFLACAANACLGVIEGAPCLLLRVEQSPAFSEDTLRRMMLSRQSQDAAFPMPIPFTPPYGFNQPAARRAPAGRRPRRQRGTIKLAEAATPSHRAGHGGLVQPPTAAIHLAEQRRAVHHTTSGHRALTSPFQRPGLEVKPVMHSGTAQSTAVRPSAVRPSWRLRSGWRPSARPEASFHAAATGAPRTELQNIGSHVQSSTRRADTGY